MAGGVSVLIFPADLDVRAMTAEGDRILIKAWLPNWDENSQTMELYGYVDSKSVKLLEPAKVKDQ